MTNMQTRPLTGPRSAHRTRLHPDALAGGSTSPSSARASSSASTYTAADEEVLVEHDWLSKDDLAVLRAEAAQARCGALDVLIQRGVYSAAEIDLCLETDDWWKRSTADHLAHITSTEAIEGYKHSFAVNGWFTIPHVLSREQLYEMDLAMHRIALAHVDADPVKHKLYHSIGQRLYTQPATVSINGHPALQTIARAFLGDDLVQAKSYLKVDHPYRYNGMFGHTHAETHYDCLTQALYMFLYMDTTTRECGGFEIIPFSHEWYSRGPDGRTLYRGAVLESESPLSNKASLTHDSEPARRWAGYETLPMSGNTLLVLSPFLWHGVRPVRHRRRLMFTAFFDARHLTRDFVMRSDYFGNFPYDLASCDLSLLTAEQRRLLDIHLDREKWLAARGL